jgi:hypothetical protein
MYLVSHKFPVSLKKPFKVFDYLPHYFCCQIQKAFSNVVWGLDEMCHAKNSRKIGFCN